MADCILGVLEGELLTLGEHYLFPQEQEGVTVE